MQAEIKILDERIKTPEYETAGAGAIDLRAAIYKPVKILPNQCELIGTGIAIHIGSIDSAEGDEPNPEFTLAGAIIPRSGLGNRGLVLGNLVGLADADYQGEIKVSLWNRGSEVFIINPLDRIAQMMIVPVIRPSFKVVDQFSSTSSRGNGGFGSTGVK